MDYRRTEGVVNVQTVRPGGKKGIVLAKQIYDEFRQFIVQVLETEEDVTTNKLIDLARETFTEGLDGDMGWYILQVKLDMEARGWIKHYVPLHEKKTPFMKLTGKGKRKLRMASH
jgi:hypothetical protein